MSTLYVDNLQPNLGSRVMAAGHVVQVLQANKTDTFVSMNAATFTDVPDLSLSITPTSATSKILVVSDIALGHNTNAYAYYRVLRDSTHINGGDVVSGQPNINGMTYDNANNGIIQRVPMTYLDSPSTTSSITYKVQVATGSTNTSIGVYVNKSAADAAYTTYYPRMASSLILMEIAQ